MIDRQERERAREKLDAGAKWRDRQGQTDIEGYTDATVKLQLGYRGW